MSLYATRLLELETNPPLRVRVAEIPPREEARAGPPLLVIPGWLGDIGKFVDLATALSAIGPVTIYEPHGFGASTAPHLRGLFGESSYVEEIGCLLRALEMPHRGFVLLGSSTGAALALAYHLDGDGPKPYALALLSPQLSFRVPEWFSLVGLLPSRAARAVQNAILRVLRAYLRLASPADVRNVDFAASQLTRWDDWTLRRFLFEFVKPCALERRVSKLDVPVVAFAAERDWFASHPAPRLLRAAGSRLEIMAAGAHRFQEGREDEVAQRLAAALEALS